MGLELCWGSSQRLLVHGLQATIPQWRQWCYTNKKYDTNKFSYFSLVYFTKINKKEKKIERIRNYINILNSVSWGKRCLGQEKGSNLNSPFYLLLWIQKSYSACKSWHRSQAPRQVNHLLCFVECPLKTETTPGTTCSNNSSHNNINTWYVYFS